MASIEEMSVRCELIAHDLETMLPSDVGHITILFNRSKGQIVMRAPNCSRRQTDAIFKSLIARPDDKVPLIINPRD